MLDKLEARLMVLQSYHAPGVLICNLPPADRPGTVNITLSQTPSLGAPTYATSLVKFTYESDTNRAFVISYQNHGNALTMHPVPHTFLKFVTRRFVWKLCHSSSECSGHMGTVSQLVTRRKQVLVTVV